jgi:trimethylamine--corrinoid protein Co-methyltransferase
MSETPEIQSLPPTLRLDVLSAEALGRVREQTLEVLGNVGVGIGAAETLERLAGAGANVDRDAKRVRFSPALVEELLGRVPATFELAARDLKQDLRIDGSHGYLSVDGSAAEIIDLGTGERRASTKQDLAQVSRLADALPEIGLLWQGVAARDVPRRVQSLHELHAQLTNSSKHVQMMTAVTPEAAGGVVEIARAVAGGSEELRRRPIVSAFQCSLSPLMYEEGSLEAAVVYAEAGVPCGFVVMPISCATGPATAAGNLVQSNAEVLAGILALQALVPGAITFYGSCATVMDLHTGAAACGGPEDLFLQMASAQLARSYGIPASIGTFATGAKSPDWQAGLENGLSGLVSCLAGADLLCGAGLLYGARVFSLVEMVLDCEIFGMIRHLVDPLSMALDDEMTSVIAEVGPGGHYLSQPHTLAKMRDHWMPQMFDRLGWEEWEAAGHPGPQQAAAAKVESILSTHEPVPLEEGLEKEILGIIHAYERGNEGD